MNYFCFELKKDATIDTAWEALSLEGFILLYSEEEPAPSQLKKLYGYLPEGLSVNKVLHQYPLIASINEMHFDQIDWNAQWGADQSNFVTYDLAAYSPDAHESFKMIPGPGFGDLSHPTTRLVLRLMAPLVLGKFVIDLGCGSGVLSLAAGKLGAKETLGIDIDEKAIEHARSNATLNGLDKICHFQLNGTLKIPPDSPLLLAMNMITSEQEKAWESTSVLHSLPMLCITSGVLKSEEKIYIENWEARGWQLLKTLHEEQWCGFLFQSF